MEMTIDRRETQESLELVVSGRLDAEHAGELARVVDEELRRGHHALALDLRDCGFLSSAGIRVLFEIHRAAQGVGGRCLIRSASEPVRKVLELTRLAPLLMESAAGSAAVLPAAAARRHTAVDLERGPIRFIGLEQPPATPLRGRLVGTPGGFMPADLVAAERLRVPPDGFAIGLAALADDSPLAARAGEMLAACGVAFDRRPQPFSVVDYLAAAGDLVPEVDAAAAVAWQGMPQGRAGFEAAAEDGAVPLDELVGELFVQTAADALAVVVVGEVQGLVGAELIRPLAEATTADRPGSPRREIAARWLSFSREPVHVRRTALIVGVASRGAPRGPLAAFVRPLGSGTTQGHFHAVVFPLRPLKRGSGDLAATVADVTTAEPLGLMHLLADPQPVLGTGRSQLVRGRCWFAPLAIEEQRG
jgi:anti-anti-sigma factor